MRSFLEIDPAFFFKLFADMADEQIVHVRTTELGVAVGGQNLKSPGLVLIVPAHLEDGNVERPAAEIKDHDLLLFARFIQGRTPDTPPSVR